MVYVICVFLFLMVVFLLIRQRYLNKKIFELFIIVSENKLKIANIEHELELNEEWVKSAVDAMDALQSQIDSHSNRMSWMDGIDPNIFKTIS